MNEEVLVKVGLTKNEARVYIALLRLGSASVTEISQKSKVERTLVYGVLERLMEKGLVSSIIKINKRYFEPADPAKILETLKEKERIIEQPIPELREIYQSVGKKQEIHHFKGKNGLRNILETLLESGKETKEWFIFGTTERTKELLPSYLPQFHRKRIEQGIKFKAIYSTDSKERGLEVKKLKLTEVRFLPKEYTTPTAVSIVGNKVAILLWSIENPLGVIIENEEVANDFKKYFNLLWKIAKP